MVGINSKFQGLETFKSTQKGNGQETKESKKVKIPKDDIYMKWPLRGLAYSNEIGEVIRPMSGLLANLLWIPAIGYIAADVGDKYKHNEYGEHDPSKKRAGKQLSFQMLASVFLPTAAVKVGQKLTNIISSKGKDKLALNHREDITNRILDSMNKGTHEKFVDASTGLVDRAKYTQHIMENFAEMDKHKKTHNKMFEPIAKVIDFVKRPFEAKPKTENIEKYVAKTIDNVMDMREALIEGKKPTNVSNKLFKAFEKAAKGGNLEQKKSAAFNVIKKAQGNKLFKNNALKSLGGFIALGLAMKPIDNFVEHVLIEKYIGPTIDKLGSSKPWKPLSEVVKADNNENKTSAA